MICTAHTVPVREDGAWAYTYHIGVRSPLLVPHFGWAVVGLKQRDGQPIRTLTPPFLYIGPHTSNQSSHLPRESIVWHTYHVTMDAMIIIKGAGSRGKSSTLRELIKLLADHPGSSIVYNDRDCYPDESRDWFVIIESIGQRIGVITEGDPGSQNYVAGCLQKCLEEQCDAIVGASRTRYDHDRPTTYAVLWDFGRDHNMRIVESTPYVTWQGWGKDVDRKMLYRRRAADIAALLQEMHHDVGTCRGMSAIQ